MAPIGLFIKYSSGLLLGRKKIEVLNYIKVLNSVGVLILIIIFVGIFGLRILGMGISYLLIQCALVIVVLRWVGRYASLVPKWVTPIPSEILKKGIAYALSLFVVTLNLRFDMLMLGKIQGMASVGIYSLGVNVCELLKQVPLAIGFVLFAHSTNWTQSQKFNSLRKVAFITRLLLLMSLATGILLAILANWLIPIFYGVAFTESIKVVWVAEYAKSNLKKKKFILYWMLKRGFR